MPETQVRELTFAQAVKEALAEEMRRDPRVCIMGEDVAEAGTPFKVLSGLVEEFGKDRVMDTPISEAGFTGIGVGAAMTGMRPVIDIMFGDLCRWSCGRLWGRRADRQRNTRNHCMPG
jgi:pyruvate dehydrogenase E1 component beta subunit